MPDFDLVIRGGTVVTAADTYRADIGIRDGRVATIGEGLDGAQKLDADGLLVLPGGVERIATSSNCVPRRLPTRRASPPAAPPASPAAPPPSSPSRRSSRAAASSKR